MSIASRLLACTAVASTAVMLALSPPRADAALPVPPPTVEGPIPAVTPGDPSRNYPFIATSIDLAARGYVEEEFFISGTACRYNGVGLATAAIRDCGFPYKTRIIVRRPASARTFNGTVLAEWQNVTAQYDIDHYWLESSEHIMRSGYAWVGISAQRAGVQPLPPPASPLTSINTLKAWSPLRYGSLDVTAGGTVLDDSLRFDIFSQAVIALRAPAGTGPLGPLSPSVVIALGTSQSGSNLAAYHNSIAPLYERVADAYFIGESRGVLRTDLVVPVLRLLSEVDVRSNFAPPDAANYRHWEVAGASGTARSARPPTASVPRPAAPRSATCTTPRGTTWTPGCVGASFRRSRRASPMTARTSCGMPSATRSAASACRSTRWPPPRIRPPTPRRTRARAACSAACSARTCRSRPSNSPGSTVITGSTSRRWRG